MAQSQPDGQNNRKPRDLRYRTQFFPGSESLVFKTKQAGFVPLPILFRKLLRHLGLAEVRLYVYLATRASKHGICWLGMEEMVHELGVSSKKHVEPHIKELIEKQLISTHHANGRRYFLIHDPRVALEALQAKGRLSQSDLGEIDDLMEELSLAPLSGRGSTEGMV